MPIYQYGSFEMKTTYVKNKASLARGGDCSQRITTISLLSCCLRQLSGWVQTPNKRIFLFAELLLLAGYCPLNQVFADGRSPTLKRLSEILYLWAAKATEADH